MSWNARYDTPEYVFGTAPSQVLERHAARLIPGQSALAVADGEGRNSVFLAERGMRVTAFDGAENALLKARALAGSRGVEVRYDEADILTYDWDAAQYDLVVAIFIQFLTPEERGPVFEGLLRATRPGGLILLHGYGLDQLAHGTGGPREASQLYTEDMLRKAFAGREILELRSYEAVLEEGPGHSGPSALVDLLLRA